MQGSIISSSRIIIATHELYYGAPQALRDYLVGKHGKELVYISHPIRPENTKSQKDLYKNGKLLHSFSFARPSGSAWWFGVDFFLTIVWGIGLRGRYDVYIGVDPLNCLSGLVLRSLGLVKCVIFYSIDFTPKRFPQKLVNDLYHAIESFCVRFADIRWDISPRIAEGREKFLGLKQKDYPVTVVPVGMWEKDIAGPNSNFDAYRIVFVGHLLRKQGVDKVLEALFIVRKKIKDVTLLIIGGGEEEGSLRRLASKLHLGKNVEFPGWMWDQGEIRKLLLGCAFAVATYDPQGAQEDNFTYYADPTKIKTYLSCGLPVIMTNVPFNAGDLARRGCAVIVDYDEKSIAKVLIDVLTDKEKLETMRKSAIKTAGEFTWEEIFKKTLSGEGCDPFGFLEGSHPSIAQ